jgi:hypothetical protein
MKNNMLLLLILFITISNSMSIKKSDICSKEPFEICEEPFNHRCSEEYCAKSRKTCERINKFQKIFDLTNNRLKTKIGSYFENFKTCKSLEADICLNSNNECFVKKYNHFTKSQITLKLNTCPCNDPEFPFKCKDSKFCGTDKDECDKLPTKKQDQKIKCKID